MMWPWSSRTERLGPIVTLIVRAGREGRRRWRDRRGEAAFWDEIGDDPGIRKSDAPSDEVEIFFLSSQEVEAFKKRS